MIVVMLRVQAELLQLEQLSWLPEEGLQRTWRKGEARRGAVANETSGFSLLLSEGNDAAQVISDAAIALEPLAEFLRQLAEQGASGEVDLGVMVDAAGAAMQSLRLPDNSLR